MRSNLPVTMRERTFSAQVKLISTTDLNSKILHCNDAFIDISGFSKEELIGQPHNIVRHPDMPPLAYEIMWQHLKTGKPWMGLVKNRSKNGDFYWVNAYITPITEQGKIVGYESVRSCPSRSDVARADKLYKAINAGGFKSTPFYLKKSALYLLVAFIVNALLYSLGSLGLLQLGLLVTVLSYAFLAELSRRESIQAVKALLGDAFTHPLASRTYTDDQPDVGELKVAIMSSQAHLGAVLTRIEDAAVNVSRQAERGLKQADATMSRISQQQQETEQAATAINEMTTTIAEVSQHVQHTAEQAEQANELAGRSRESAATTRKSIESLRNTVQNISSSVAQVSEQTHNIASVAQMIEQIAEQTNLLALNAAIEAARAGEQGRGFAVVADEVRNLAKRTQDSTREIHSIINELSNRADAAVKVAEDGTKGAETGLQQVKDTEQMLNGISESVEAIASMSIQMATAVEQQAHVAEDVNRQVVSIASLANDSLTEADNSAKTTRRLQQIANELHELVVRFKR
ncbi:methyl-accepting chemotaxis protein [Arsukibacterium sp.]|uniref:methyl-accepting chemotaxis protein n=1 Tax=Arsukibacterium sp. TaxID=1977258 RepID=UPI002FDAD838